MENGPKPQITQNDVAQRAGVSRSMVSYVLTGYGRAVAPETRQKILDAINNLGYRPNKYAQALSKGNGRSLADRHIGIVLCDVEKFLRPYYAEILAGIHLAAHEKGFHIRFIRFFDELKDPILYNQLIHGEEICGILLVALDQSLKTPEDRQIIDGIRERIDQIVCVEWQMPGLSSVSFDRQNAAFQAVSYLFDQGYRDIVYLGELDQRVLGFRQAFLERGREAASGSGLDGASGLYIDDAADMPSGYEAVQRLHRSRPALPRAILAGSDEVALGLLLYLHEQRVAVPEEVAVISIDNLEIAAYAAPPLTTMNVQKRAMGRRAVEMIVNRTAGQNEHALSLLLPVNLVVRKSA
ncbi:MAG: LacI family transcriptional regulator [Spirochaetaceae bacterium]|jgi:LacI family transcriptional regulator|nr:LacI family transcriptional regulator [Spirochaetaceae bacterium]